MSFREEDHRVKVPFSSHHFKNIDYQRGQITLDHLAEVVFVKFLKLTDYFLNSFRFTEKQYREFSYATVFPFINISC